MEYNPEESKHSENLYAYNESEGNEDEAPKESNAIRRSIGRGDNPYKNNLKYSSSINPIQENNINNNLNNNNPSYDKHYPNYQEKSTEQRLPTINQKNSEVALKQKKPNNINNNQDSSEENQNEIQLNNMRSKNLEPDVNNNQRQANYVLTMLLILLQIIAIIVLAVAYKRGDGDPNNFGKDSEFGYFFHYMKDVHLMIFIGFGLLYCSLRVHQFSSISLVLFLGLLSLEFSLLWNYFWNNAMRKKIFTNYEKKWSRLKLNMEEITQIDFFAASAIISLGSWLGKLTLGQYLLAILFETFFAAFNYFLCYFAIGGIDTGGSLYIFTFGAIFGFTVSFVLSYDNRFRERMRNNKNKKSDYYSNIISAIGSLFIWLYFPSFNTAKIHCDHDKEVMEIMRYRGIINTYMSMIGSTMVTFCMSALLSNQKFKMEHILRSSYVGGVIIAGSCTFCAYPWCAMIIGCIGGILSVVFLHLTRIEKGEGVPSQEINNNFLCLYDCVQSIKMSDTMGVLYCFGIPGILGGLCNVIFLGCLGKKPWKNLQLVNFFYYDRSPSKQVGIQIAVLFITIAIALISGILIGLIERFFTFYERDIAFTDSTIFIENSDNTFSGFKKKTFLSSSENRLNDEEKEGAEVEINNNN